MGSSFQVEQFQWSFSKLSVMPLLKLCAKGPSHFLDIMAVISVKPGVHICTGIRKSLFLRSIIRFFAPMNPFGLKLTQNTISPPHHSLIFLTLTWSMHFQYITCIKYFLVFSVDFWTFGSMRKKDSAAYTQIHSMSSMIGFLSCQTKPGRSWPVNFGLWSTCLTSKLLSFRVFYYIQARLCWKYTHFLCLSIATSILSDTNMAKDYRQYAHELLLYFA